jgi:large subunit ribosomal protein L5
MPRLQSEYQDKIVGQLMERFGYKSVMQVPRVVKITLNMGVGEAVADKKIMDHAVSDLTSLAGQKPIVTYARKSVAAFKIREGWPVGCKVTCVAIVCMNSWIASSTSLFLVFVIFAA